MIKWAMVALVIVGDLLIIQKNRGGFALWVLCDGFFCITSILEKMYPEALVFGIYAVLGLVGYQKWKTLT